MNASASQKTTMIQLASITRAASGIDLLELRPLHAELRLPAFTAGAHIDLHLPNGLVRQYSIASAQGDRSKYILGVKLAPDSRGGSRYIHDHLRVGTVIEIGVPRNNFPLEEDAAHSVFIAGGIGITPIHSMIDRLVELGRPYALHYAVRTRDDAFLLGAVAPGSPELHLHVDEEQGGPIDVSQIVATAPREAHLYCCGPAPMLRAFEAACSDRPLTQVHLERFGPALEPQAAMSYDVKLARSERVIRVEKGQSLLKALQDAGVDVSISCEQGICGTCETTVLSGIPDHKDSILSDQEKLANRTMMICCSGSLSDTLVLDL